MYYVLCLVRGKHERLICTYVHTNAHFLETMNDNRLVRCIIIPMKELTRKSYCDDLPVPVCAHGKYSVYNSTVEYSTVQYSYKM